MFKKEETISQVEISELLPIDEKTGLIIGLLPVDQTFSQSFNIDIHNNIMNDVSAYFAATDEMQKQAIALRLERVLPVEDMNKGKSVRQILDEIPSSRAQHFSEIFEQAQYFRQVAEKYHKPAEPAAPAAAPVTSKTDTQILDEV